MKLGFGEPREVSDEPLWAFQRKDGQRVLVGMAGLSKAGRGVVSRGQSWGATREEGNTGSAEGRTRVRRWGLSEWRVCEGTVGSDSGQGRLARPHRARSTV